MNPQAKELNDIIAKENSAIFDLLSEKGRNIFFPKKGILGQTAQARGTKINATIGAAYEDDGTPMRLHSIEKLINLEPQQIFPYAPSFGRPDIRSVWKEMIYKKNPSLQGKEIGLPVVTNALTHGLSICGYLFLDPGDELIISDIYWGNYNLIFTNAYGSKMKAFNTFSEGRMDLKALKAALNDGAPGKRVLLLNFPNNPTGYTPAIDEMKELVNIIRDSADSGNKIVVLADDAYFGLVYEDGIEKESVFSYLADLHKNLLAVKLDGATKEDYVWGFRVGFLTFGVKGGNEGLYTALEAKAAGAIRGNISNTTNLSQSVLLSAFESPTYWDEKKEKYQILKGRCNKVKEVISDPKYKEYFEELPFNSGYFMCVKLKNGLDGEAVRTTLIEKYSTGVINMAGTIRIAYSCTPVNQVQELFDNLYEACRDNS